MVWKRNGCDQSQGFSKHDDRNQFYKKIWAEYFVWKTKREKNKHMDLVAPCIFLNCD